MASAAVAAAAAPLRRSLLPSLNPSCLFSSLASSSHRLSLPRALRPAGPLPSDVEDSDDSNAGDGAGEALRKSRNDLKREARRAVQWGMDLAKFSPPQIKRILRAASLDREVFDALMLVKRFGSDVREGKRRQFNYIGIFTYWVNWIHATANMSIQKNVTTIQYIGYVALKIVEIGSMPLHHVFRQKSLLAPSCTWAPPPFPLFSFLFLSLHHRRCGRRCRLRRLHHCLREVGPGCACVVVVVEHLVSEPVSHAVSVTVQGRRRWWWRRHHRRLSTHPCHRCRGPP
ncbi:uncharacterized protein [Oryza sativa Japonica Group]|nr:uncharacterized protein LOC9268902 isoform X1 [Oryza sativa Japonica Group]